MLYLKKANLEDWEKEYEYFAEIPADENGFTNPQAGVSAQEFRDVVLPGMLASDEGVGLPAGYVAQTSYFLWDDDRVVGLFRLRKSLTDGLRNGAGHIGYAVRRDCRGKGYGTRGLALLIEEAKTVLKDDEIYMSANINNPASLAVMTKNGAYVHHSDEEHHYTRIKL